MAAHQMVLCFIEIRYNEYGKTTSNMQLSPPTEDALERGNTCVRQVPFPAVTYQTQGNCHLERPVGLTFTQNNHIQDCKTTYSHGSLVKAVLKEVKILHLL